MDVKVLVIGSGIAGVSAARTVLDAPEAAAPADTALPHHGIATTDTEHLTRCLKHTMSTYCMINRTEAGLSKALQELESLQDEAITLCMPHANDSEISAFARLQSQI